MRKARGARQRLAASSMIVRSHRTGMIAMTTDGRSRLAARLISLLHDTRDKDAVGGLVADLDSRYSLLAKLGKEPGV